MTTTDETAIALRQLAWNSRDRTPDEVSMLLRGAASYIETLATLLEDATTDLGKAQAELGDTYGTIDRIREVVCGT